MGTGRLGSQFTVACLLHLRHPSMKSTMTTSGAPASGMDIHSGPALRSARLQLQESSCIAAAQQHAATSDVVSVCFFPFLLFPVLDSLAHRRMGVPLLCISSESSAVTLWLPRFALDLISHILRSVIAARQPVLRDPPGWLVL